MENFTLPENLDGLSSEDLQGLEASALAEFNTLNDSDATDDATIERMAKLAADIKSVRAAAAAKVAASTAADRKASLAAETGAAAVVVPAPVAPAPVAASVAEPVVAAVVEPEPVEALAASAAIPAQPVVQTEIPENHTPRVVITAAADIPRVPSGSNLDLAGLSEAMHLKARTLSDRSGYVPIASIQKEFPRAYDLSDLSEVDQFEAIMDGASSASLVASGGWCAPSEIIYSFFDLECARGSVVQLPTFRVSRGGARWPISTPLPAVDTTDWVWTEADDIAGTSTKPCITVPCPDFDECRLDAHGICVTAGNLMSRAYPENLRRYLNQVFIAHERNENLRKLATLVALSTPAVLGATFGAASALLAGIQLQVADYRDKFRMCDGSMLEAVFPIWIRDLLRVDIARQEGSLNGEGRLPTNADIAAWFRLFGVNAQFVNDWQPFTTSDPQLVWPSTVSFLLYAAGTFVQFDGGNLDLGVIRDSTLNATNDYTAAWTEEFYCIGLRGYESRYVTVPVCPNGDVGGFNVSGAAADCPLA